MNQFKRAQVVMLPTESITKLRTYCGSQLHISHSTFKEPYYQDQHLYIISDDEIKEGDWFISTEFDIVGQLQKGEKITTEKVKKIIATTDTSLNKKHDCDCGATTYEGCSQCLEVLPQPSQQFIEQYIESYNKGEIITDVLIELDIQHLIDETNGEIVEYTDNTLKVNPKDNSINIKKLKDNWNREEHIVNIMYCLSLFAAERGLTPTSKEMKIVNEWGDNWCNKNL